jgi:hypothetical protein
MFEKFFGKITKIGPVHIFCDMSEVIGKGSVWIGYEGMYMYMGNSLPHLCWVILKERKNDKHLAM